MREIKFRGLRTDGKGWVYGYYWSIDGSHFIRGIILKNLHPYDIEVIPESVGQYTGLTDKNFAEIYEGDVIKAKGFNTNYSIMFGEFNSDESNEKATNVGFYFNDSEKYKSSFGKNGNGTMDYIEIIGNIHQNPELCQKQ